MGVEILYFLKYNSLDQSGNDESPFSFATNLNNKQIVIHLVSLKPRTVYGLDEVKDGLAKYEASMLLWTEIKHRRE